MTQSAPTLTPIGTAAQAGVFSLTVSEVQFGEQALTTLTSANKGNVAPPNGLIWCLAHVTAENRGAATLIIDSSDFAAAGSDGILRRPPQLESPKDTLQGAMKAGESVSGWVPLHVSDDTNVVLWFDSATLGGSWANAWFALTEGATLPAPSNAADSGKGSTAADPAAFGETVRSGGFDVTVLEHVNGQAVLDMATSGLAALAWGEDLSTWHAFRVRVANVSDRPLFFSSTALRIADRTGEPWDHLMALSAPVPDAAKLLLPGATFEGWQAIKTEAWSTLDTLRVLPFTQRDDARFFTFSGDQVAAEANAATPSAKATSFKKGDVVKLSDTPVYLRESASANGKVIRELDGTSTLTITGDAVSADGHTWYPVTVDASGESGFVAADFLELSAPN